LLRSIGSLLKAGQDAALFLCQVWIGLCLEAKLIKHCNRPAHADQAQSVWLICCTQQASGRSEAPRWGCGSAKIHPQGEAASSNANTQSKSHGRPKFQGISEHKYCG
jgi:hypothetical protein